MLKIHSMFSHGFFLESNEDFGKLSVFGKWLRDFWAKSSINHFQLAKVLYREGKKIYAVFSNDSFKKSENGKDNGGAYPAPESSFYHRFA